MTKAIPWHSDLDRDIGLFLVENRNLSPDERLRFVYERILEANLAPETLLHYAACMFTCRDLLFKGAEEFPQQLCTSMLGGKKVADHVTKQEKSKIGKNAADALHDKPGGSRSKSDEIRLIWATGKFTTRVRCAEEECAALGMSLETARKALRNTPKPPSRCAA